VCDLSPAAAVHRALWPASVAAVSSVTDVAQYNNQLECAPASKLSPLYSPYLRTARTVRRPASSSLTRPDASRPT
jgi:hypothetical protein